MLCARVCVCVCGSAPVLKGPLGCKLMAFKSQGDRLERPAAIILTGQVPHPHC